MRAGSVEEIEKNVDRAASVLFAAACAYAALVSLASRLASQMVIAETAAAAAIAYGLSLGALSSVKPRARKLPVPVFDVREIDPIELPELLLTERYEAPQSAAGEPVLLEQVLAELAQDSRVVRLFDPASMPTPGQLKSRIDRHLDEGATEQPPDAVQALHDALAELRRSLR